MSNRGMVLVIGYCLALGGAAWLVLGWVSESVESLELPGFAGLPLPDEAGEELDPAAVGWLGYAAEPTGVAPERTRVDPEQLREAFRRLEEQVRVLGEGKTEHRGAIIDRVFVPAGWAESRSIEVLTGASGYAEIEPATDRCRFLTGAAAALADLGWQLRTGSREAIQTTYPLVSPGPRDLTLTGRSPTGTFELNAFADGRATLSWSVSEQHLPATIEPPTPTRPPVILCE